MNEQDKLEQLMKSLAEAHKEAGIQSDNLAERAAQAYFTEHTNAAASLSRAQAAAVYQESISDTPETQPAKPSFRERVGNFWRSVRERTRNFFRRRQQPDYLPDEYANIPSDYASTSISQNPEIETIYQSPLQNAYPVQETAAKTVPEQAVQPTVQQQIPTVEAEMVENSPAKQNAAPVDHQKVLEKLIRSEATAFQAADISYDVSHQIVEDSAKLYLSTYAVADAENLLKGCNKLYQQEMQVGRTPEQTPESIQSESLTLIEKMVPAVKSLQNQEQNLYIPLSAGAESTSAVLKRENETLSLTVDGHQQTGAEMLKSLRDLSQKGYQQQCVMPDKMKEFIGQQAVAHQEAGILNVNAVENDTIAYMSQHPIPLQPQIDVVSAAMTEAKLQYLQQPAASAAAPEPVQSESVRLQLPEKVEGLNKHVFSYLNLENGIDRDIIKDTEKRGLLYQDKDHYAVFVGKDKDGKPASALQHTTFSKSSFQRVLAGSNPDVGWHIDNHADKLFVTETPLDALSLMTLRKGKGENLADANYLAVGKNAAESVKQCLHDNPQIQDVVLATGKPEIQNLVSELSADSKDLAVKAAAVDGGAHMLLQKKRVVARDHAAAPKPSHTPQKSVAVSKAEDVAPSV